MINNQELTLVSHLGVLRKTLIRCFVVLGLFFIPIYFFSLYALEWYCNHFLLFSKVSFHYFSPMEVFILQIKTAALLDVILCAPFIIWQVWKFILPALYVKEIRFARYIICLTSLLFVLGVCFNLFICFPYIIDFGLSYSNDLFKPVWGISNIISLAIGISLAFGCMFQFPLVTFSLIWLNMVSYKSMSQLRPYVIVCILIFAAFLTPPDIFSQLILGIPTYLLFEFGLLASRFFKTKKHKPSLE